MIYLTSDTHREIDIHKINPDEFLEGLKMNRDDYLIICGDFGCIWDGDSGDRFWLNWLESLPWTTLFIDGNHENFDVLNSYPEEEWHGGRVHRIRTNIFHLMRGEVFTIKDQTFFTFGGAYSHDRIYRKEHETWWKDEIPTKKECAHALETLDKYHWKVDYVLTHDVFLSHPLSAKYETDIQAYGAQYQDIHEFLNQIEQKLEYTAWFHGHYHTDQLYRTPQGKPILCLYDRVVSLKEILPELGVK
ncbi:metallophosphoesterase [uncultured Faecalicoccus sp.]|uniref:metallophosphoesterase family protein n=1 Tax=uncultured Faecalicoccus sp. TaxID=1971760 RepID=UPI002610D7C2|nr:metallophosphoesterase [uncultured Faecalicoccus sp.]